MIGFFYKNTPFMSESDAKLFNINQPSNKSLNIIWQNY
jgi:hypothetical protein